MATDETIYPYLHHLESSQSLRILWALEQLNEERGLQYGIKIYPRNWKGNPTKEIHPMGKSPVLCIGPEPEQAMSESRLILVYLSDTYGKGLWDPDNEEDVKRNLFFQEFAHSSLLAKVDMTLMFDLPQIAYPFGLRHLCMLFNWPFKNHMLNDLQMHYQYLENVLSDERPWFGGKKLGLADFAMSFGMDMATAKGYFDEKKYPKLRNWQDRVHSLPAYKRALEKGGKYNLKSFS